MAPLASARPPPDTQRHRATVIPFAGREALSLLRRTDSARGREVPVLLRVARSEQAAGLVDGRASSERTSSSERADQRRREPELRESRCRSTEPCAARGRSARGRSSAGADQLVRRTRSQPRQADRELPRSEPLAGARTRRTWARRRGRRRQRSSTCTCTASLSGPRSVPARSAARATTRAAAAHDRACPAGRADPRSACATLGDSLAAR